MASATKMTQVMSQRSMREKVSETGVFCLATPEMLISMRRVVISNAILPGSKPGGIKKLEKETISNREVLVSPSMLSEGLHWLLSITSCLPSHTAAQHKQEVKLTQYSPLAFKHHLF